MLRGLRVLNAMPEQRCNLGAACELIVCADLLRRGFSVYRNVSPAGVTDLVALKDGRVLRVQVKSSGAGSKHEKAANDVVATCRFKKILYLVCNPQWAGEFRDARMYRARRAPVQYRLRAAKAMVRRYPHSTKAAATLQKVQAEITAS
jgi:hypothetical protein